MHGRRGKGIKVRLVASMAGDERGVWRGCLRVRWEPRNDKPITSLRSGSWVQFRRPSGVTLGPL